jgi:hypothetical protein
VRWNTNTDTPLPPDEPNAPNPPEGAIIDYYLKEAVQGPVTLEIDAADGRLVRRYSSDDPVFRPDPATIPVPLYWYRPPITLSTAAGMHRFTWDVHYQPLDGNRVGGPNLPISAVPHNTVPAPTTPWVNPGRYTVKLTVNGRTYTQPIVVKADPRVKTPGLAMQTVYTQSRAAYYAAVDARHAAEQARALRAQATQRQSKATGALAQALGDFAKKLDAIAGAAPASGRGGRGGGPVASGSRRGASDGSADTLESASAGLAAVMNLLQAADVTPTTVQLHAMASARAAAARVTARWAAMKSVDVAALNAKLKTAGLEPLTIQDEQR